MSDQQKSVQRVRIGLTGLAFIFLLVVLAAIIANPSTEEPITANRIEQGSVGNEAAVAEAAAADEQPKEPLAELGVAPGAGEANGAEATPPVTQ